MFTMTVEIFRAGKYPQGDWPPEQVQAVADNYDPKFFTSPVTLDHAETGPAMGWVGRLFTRQGGRRLFAELTGLATEFVDAVQAGRFRHRSVELYPKLEEIGGPYLRAVTFLGAGKPQVKGMGDIPAFSESWGQATSLEFDAARDAGGGGDNTDTIIVSLAEPPRAETEEVSTVAEPAKAPPPPALAQAIATINSFAERTGGITVRADATADDLAAAFGELVKRHEAAVREAEELADRFAEQAVDLAVSGDHPTVALGVGDAAKARRANLVKFARREPALFADLFGPGAKRLDGPRESGEQTAGKSEADHERWREEQIDLALSLVGAGKTKSKEVK